jgi:hypothetical protein
VDGPVLLTGSVTVNAIGGDYTGTSTQYNYAPGDGVRAAALTLDGAARLTAVAGSYTGALTASGSGRVGGNGIVLFAHSADAPAVLTINSTAANALVSTGGTTRATGAAPAWTGNGIAALDINYPTDLVISGTGQIKTTGHNGIYSDGDLALNGGKTTAEGTGADGYGLYTAGGGGTGGVVTIADVAGLTLIAVNETNRDNDVHGTLVDPGQKLNAGVNNNNNTNNTGGGGGGGAPTLPALALIAVLLARRALKTGQ